MFNAHGVEIFPYQHGWLTAQELEDYGKAKDQDDAIAFQACLWAHALAAYLLPTR